MFSLDNTTERDIKIIIYLLSSVNKMKMKTFIIIFHWMNDAVWFHSVKIWLHAHTRAQNLVCIFCSCPCPNDFSLFCFHYHPYFLFIAMTGNNDSTGHLHLLIQNKCENESMRKTAKRWQLRERARQTLVRCEQNWRKKTRNSKQRERTRTKKKRMHVVREIENRIDFHQDSIFDAS